MNEKGSVKGKLRVRGRVEINTTQSRQHLHSNFLPVQTDATERL